MENYGFSNRTLFDLCCFVLGIFTVIGSTRKIPSIYVLGVWLLVCIFFFLVRKLWPVPVAEADVLAVLRGAECHLTQEQIVERLARIFNLTNTWRKINQDSVASHLVSLLRTEKIGYSTSTDEEVQRFFIKS